MEKHYVCPACGGVADHQKNCETEGCRLEGQPLVECNCEDGMHADVMEEAPDEEMTA